MPKQKRPTVSAGCTDYRRPSAMLTSLLPVPEGLTWSASEDHSINRSVPPVACTPPMGCSLGTRHHPSRAFHIQQPKEENFANRHTRALVGQCEERGISYSLFRVLIP